MDIVVSCPNFLRPIYHTLSASQAPKQGPCPMVNTDADYSSCFFCSIVTDLHSSIMVLIYSVDAIPLWLTVGLLQMQSVPDSIIYGFLFQNPVQSPMHSISHSTEFWSYFFYFIYYAAIGACEAAGCLISFKSFCGS